MTDTPTGTDPNPPPAILTPDGLARTFLAALQGIASASTVSLSHSVGQPWDDSPGAHEDQRAFQAVVVAAADEMLQQLDRLSRQGREEAAFVGRCLDEVLAARPERFAARSLSPDASPAGKLGALLESIDAERRARGLELGKHKARADRLSTRWGAASEVIDLRGNEQPDLCPDGASVAEWITALFDRCAALEAQLRAAFGAPPVPAPHILLDEPLPAQLSTLPAPAPDGALVIPERLVAAGAEAGGLTVSVRLGAGGVDRPPPGTATLRAGLATLSERTKEAAAIATAARDATRVLAGRLQTCGHTPPGWSSPCTSTRKYFAGCTNEGCPFAAEQAVEGSE